ncbi:hypothetical protein H0H93_015378 [Arthromyces matolae]|nr:hypothetical protein H0H93_015378 [Arthromyces matolae]
MSLSRRAQKPTTETTPLLREDVVEEYVTIGKPEDKMDREMFWEELWTLPQDTLPVLGAQWLEYSMVAVNLISLGHLSTTALAGASLGTLTAGVTGFSMLHGLASGLETVLPAAFTSSQPQLVGLWTQRMAVVMAGSLIPIYLMWWNAEPIFTALKQDPEVARMAALYLRWISLALPAAAINIISRRYFQAQRLFYVQTRIILFVAPINALANYLLVWGPDFIRIGFAGAPIATAASYYLISIASYVHGRYLVPRTAWHPLSTKMFEDLGILVKLGVSGVAQVTSIWWAWEFAALATSYMGPSSLAAQSILGSISTLTGSHGSTLPSMDIPSSSRGGHKYYFSVRNFRYFQAQRLFYVQTRIIIFVAPFSALANYLLVWGPEPIRLGFIGAPIATVTSFYVIAIASIVHGRYLVPTTAWHPLSTKMFEDLGILVKLGLSGVAQVTSQWWAWEFAGLASS